MFEFVIAIVAVLVVLAIVSNARKRSAEKANPATAPKAPTQENKPVVKPIVNAELEKEINKPGSANAMEDDFVGQPRIVIIGCGGAGNNTVNRIHHMGVSGAETIAINTDKQHLDMIQADKRILIGKSLTKGLGAGGYPDECDRSRQRGWV